MKKMYSILGKITYIIAFVLALNIQAQAQTLCPFGKGDLIITGYDTNDDQINGATKDDRFSFALLRDIPAGQVIAFTDLGWLNAGSRFQNPALAVSDGVIKWTADRAYPVGTEIIVYCKFTLKSTLKDGTPAGVVSSVLESYNTRVSYPGDPKEYMSLGDFEGDQIFAFLAPNAGSGDYTTGITFLAGISANVSSGGWTPILSPLLPDASLSELPLTLNLNAEKVEISYNDGDDSDGFMNDAFAARHNKVSGTAFSMIAHINDAANWTVSPNVPDPLFFPFVDYTPYTVFLPSLSTVPDRLNVPRNSNTSFSVTASEACSYQWQVKPFGANTFTNITNGGVYSGATGPTLNISNNFTPNNLNGTQFMVLVRNGAGVSISNIATLTLPKPAVTSVTLNAATRTLQVNGTDFYALAGTANDIVANRLTLRAEGNFPYTLTNTPNVEITGSTSFTLPLSQEDFDAIRIWINKAGIASTGGYLYKLDAAEGWNPGAIAFDFTWLSDVSINATNISAPVVTSATYNATTGQMVVTGTNFYALASDYDIVPNGNIRLGGETGNSVTLSGTPSVDLTSSTSFTIWIPESDRNLMATYINKNGTTSTGGTLFTINTTALFNPGAAVAAANNSKPLTVTNYLPPVISSVEYNASTGQLLIFAPRIATLNGAGNDVLTNKLTFKGEGGNQYTLASTPNRDAGTGFVTINLTGADKTAVDQLLNVNGTNSIDGTAYNLSFADKWNAGADASFNISSPVNPISVNSIPEAAITSMSYNAATGVLMATGINFKALTGAANDISASKFTIQGEGGFTRVLSNTPDVDIVSPTAFSLNLGPADRAALATQLNKNGTSSTSGVSYLYTTAAGWNVGSTSFQNDPLNVSNVAIPAITSATYDASNGTLVVTGTGFLSRANNPDIDLRKLTLKGSGGTTYTFTNNSGVEISSATSFTYTLNPTEFAAVAPILNLDGTVAGDGTVYNLAAAEDWNIGADAAVVIADLTNPVTVSNAISKNADLSSLVSSTGTYAPVFSAANQTYTMTVPYSNTTIAVVPSRAESHATLAISFNGGAYVAIASGTASSAFNLNIGSNTIDIKVQAQDPAVNKVYRITVLRQAAASVGDLVWMDYNQNGVQDVGEPGIAGLTVNLTGTDQVGNAVNLTTTTNAGGAYLFSNLNASTAYKVQISGYPARYQFTYDLDGVGTPSNATFALAGGQNRTDVDFGFYDPEYTNADLLSLSTTAASGLSPAFTAANSSYTADVATAVASIQLTAVKAAGAASLQLKVNGGAYSGLTSGTATAAQPLNFGNNTFEIKVTAQNGTEKFYTVNVFRPNAPQSITFAANNSVAYGTADFDPGATSSTSGINPITYTSSNPAVATVVAGKIHVLTAGSTLITASQAASTGYNAASNVFQGLTVTKVDVTGAFTTQSKIYDRNASAAVLTQTLSGVLPADQGQVALTGGSAAFDNPNVGTAKTVTASAMSLTGSRAANYNLLSVTTATANITAKVVVVSFSANNKVYDGLTSAVISGRSVAGVFAADAANALPVNGVAEFDTKDIGNAKVVTASGISLSGTAAGNYTITGINPTTANISPQTIVVTANAAQGKLYGAAEPALTYSGAALASGDGYSGSLDRVPGEDVGSYAIGLGTLSAGTNYSISYTAANFNVNPAPLVITATGPEKPFGVALVAGTSTINFTVGATQNGEVISGVTLTPDAAGASAATAAGSAYLVTPSLATGSAGFKTTNYAINYVPFNGIVGKTAQSITFNPLSDVVYGDAPVVLSATASSGLTVSYSSSNTAVATVNGNILTIVGQGSTTITATQAGNGNFIAATVVTQNLNVAKKAIAVVASAGQTKVYGSNDPAFGYTATPLAGNDAFNGSLNRIAGENVGQYAIGIGNLNAGANYTITYTGTDFAISAKTVTVTATSGLTKVYGTSDPVFTYSINTPLISGDAFTGTLSRTTSEQVGTYPINQGNLSLGANYAITYTGANFSITTKAITATADAKTKVYGSADPVLTYTTNVALVSGDSFTGTLSRTAGENVGVYAINKNTLALSSNYTLSFTPANLTITRKALTITAENKTKFEGTANPALTAAYAGFANGDTNAALLTQPQLSTTATVNSVQGTYPIAISGATSNNYTITFVPGTLTITPGFPTTLALTQVPVFENRSAGTTAGSFASTSDDPGATFTYALVTGAGSADNGAFSILGNQLLTAQSFDFETKNSYSIRVRTTTQYGLSLENTFTVNISDVNEVPTLNAIADQAICYTTGTQTVALSGITAGPETAQTTTISVSSNNPNLFATLAVSKSGTTGTLSYSAKTVASGTATVTVTVQDNGGTANGGTDTYTRTFTVTINALPTPVITSNKGNSVGKGETIQLTATGGTSYIWATNSSIIGGQNTAVLTVRPSVTTTYTVTATNANGCSESTSFTIAVESDYTKLKSTNLLTPNNDGVNDKWVITNIDLYGNNEAKVFDIAGKLVYSKRNYDNSWDGTFNGSPLSEGTYYYIVDFGAGKGKLKGFITIVREQ